MFLIAATLMFTVPMDTPPAVKHEREFEPRLERTADETPKSIWRVDQSGAGTHLQSRLVCPASTGTFERTMLVPFDNFGFDVGCNFDSPTSGRVTIYLTKRKGMSLADEFDAAQNALKQVVTDAKLAGGETPMPAGPLAFKGALFARDDGSRTGVWIADIAGWTLKFRATYRPDHQKDALDAMAALADQAQATAGAHLGACAAAAPIARDGTRITDPDTVMELALIASVSEETVDEKLKPGEKIAEDWCAEEAAGDNEIPMLFWRNIANSGNFGPVDRMSLMTMGEPPVLVSSGNPVASLILDEKNADKSRGVYQLTDRDGDTVYIFAFFTGRPSGATLSPLARDVFTNKARPVTSYNNKTKTITLPMGAPKPGS